MSDSGSQRRPRPEYGEYATPEEQRAAIKQPAAWQLEDLEAQAEPAQPAPQHPAPQAPPQPDPRAQPAFHWPQDESRPPQQPARAGFGDRLVTFVLLGFGLYNVVDMVLNATGGGQLMRNSAESFAGGESQLIDRLPSWLWFGVAVVYSVVWLVTLFLSLASMRAGRRTFWIPLAGAVVAGILVFALMVIAVGQNPELLNIVPTPTGGSPT